MRTRDIIISVLCVVLAVALLAIAGMRLDSINSARREMRLVINEPLLNAPPSLAFATVAMGAFRGLVVDVLWMRADRLKEQGQFFDAKQLAEWITVLQPRFASVWEFQAWNMAYNISVAIPAEQPEQRWQWVKNGYELLRDKGIPLNPKSMLLYRELGRIFQHKIGSFSDDSNKYYKLQLALAMQPLLGPADDQYFDALAKAPADWRQIIEDTNVAQFVSALKAADKSFEKDDDFVNNYLSLRQNPARFDKAAFDVINRYRATETLAKFDIFAKAYYLRNVWKLDPELMLELNRTYGPIDFTDPNKHLPLDWRCPDTHAIYWAVKGLRTAGKKGVVTAGREQYSIDEVNTDRIVAHSLQNLFAYGKIFIYDLPAEQTAQPGDLASAKPQPTKEIFLRPDLRMFEPYNKAINDIIRKYTDPNIKDQDQTSHEVGQRNMLKNAVFAFYQAGHRAYAQTIYNFVRTRYPHEEFKDPSVDGYVRFRLREELRGITFNNAKEMILMMLREAYFRYAVRDDDEAFGLEKMADEVYNTYQSSYGNENRINLPDFKLIRYTALLDFLEDQQYPPAFRQGLLARIRNERPDLSGQFKQLEEKMLQEQKAEQEK